MKQASAVTGMLQSIIDMADAATPPRPGLPDPHSSLEAIRAVARTALLAIGGSMADAHAAGRTAGLEDAARWHEDQIVSLIAQPETMIALPPRPVAIHAVSAEAIRMLKAKSPLKGEP